MMQITRGKVSKPQKVVFYGPEGIGKSTFASRFPSPLFCDTEGGSNQLDVARTPTPSSWTMLLETIKEVANTPGICQTFVLDTADWAERLCIKHVCDTHDQKGVESFGYGKGYVYVYEEFGKLLNLLSDLIERGITVVVTAHAQLRKFEQPDELGSYDRYELKLSKKTGAQIADMLKEWADMVLFGNYKTLVVNVDGQGALKGKNKAQGGQRVMYTTHTPSWDAKNRHGLPEELPLDYGAIAHVIQQSAAVAPQPAPPAVTPAEKTQAPAEVPPDPAAPPLDGQTLEGDAALAAMSEASAPIPKALREPMTKDGATEQDIMFAVASKGYYPGETPIANYDPSFVNGVLIAAWPQVFAMIQANREATPF